MTARVRWLLVALVVVAVATPPTLVHVLPASGSDLSAGELAARIKKSAKLGWSGEVHSQGSLAVPKADAFSGVSRLLGEDTDLRVWWHDTQHWRVDRTRASGESDLLRNGDQVVRWSYESLKATVTHYSAVRLPNEADALPPTLTRLLLSGARTSELSRLPARRIAGHSSAGLRLVPADQRSTLSRIDIWADEGSGLPTRVEVYAQGSRTPVLTSQMTSLDVETPSLARTKFAFIKGIRTTTSYALDDAAGANAFAPYRMPDAAGGMKRTGDPKAYGAVGIYGTGPSAVIAIPLRESRGRDLYRQLAKSPAANVNDNGIDLAVGPLSILLTGGRSGIFVLVGTVQPDTLAEVGSDLRDGVTVVGR
jgi:hypothetical protein